MYKPLLSIVIPTKDRYDYLIQLVDLILSYKSDQIEIVIQDNTPENSYIKTYIEGRWNGKVNYYHHPDQLPISKNSDLAILNSTGEYVCFLGDDDGTTPLIVRATKWLKENNIEAAITSPIYYNWPDAYSVSGSRLKLLKSNGIIKIKSSRAILDKAINDGFTWRDGMPGVYHGIVKRSTLDKIYNKCGTFFPGASPDIANCVAVCLMTEKYAEMSLPVIINGVGRNHGGGDYRANIELRNLPFLPPDIIEKWESQIPKAWTATTIWCESAVKALRSMGKSELVKKVNFSYMNAVFITLYPKSRKLAYAVEKNKFALILNLIRRLCNSLVNRTKKRVDKRHVELNEIHDIKMAAETLMGMVQNDQNLKTSTYHFKS